MIAPYIFAVAIVAAGGAIWLGARDYSLNTKLVSCSTFFLWIYSFGSAWLSLSPAGRQILTVGSSTPNAGVRLTRTLCIGIVLFISLVVIALNLETNRLVSKIGLLSVFLAPWVAILLVTFAHSSSLGLGLPLYFLFGVALVLGRPQPISLCRTLGILTATTAISSASLGIFFPGEGLTVRGTGATDVKALIGDTLLAGPFGSPNTLGLCLALGLPFVLAMRTRLSCLLVAAFVLVCIAWTASRTALAASAVVLVLALIKDARHVKFAALLGSGIAALLVVTIPVYNQSDPDSFTGRGRIWAGSFAAWRQAEIFGVNPDFYESIAKINNPLGRTAFHGHNLLVTYFPVGGLFAVASIVVLLAAITWRAAQPGRLQKISAGLTVSLLITGITESTLDLRSPGYLGWLIWPGIGVVLLATTTAKNKNRPNLHEVSSTPDQLGRGRAMK